MPVINCRPIGYARSSVEDYAVGISAVKFIRPMTRSLQRAVIRWKWHNTGNNNNNIIKAVFAVQCFQQKPQCTNVTVYERKLAKTEACP